ncbi:MAG: delta-60 repeat domain-containing protein [Chthoniobacterales bacterium]|nr:delta-60 repeat domain-containing protein [Chthoniobacterales bacterium]
MIKLVPSIFKTAATLMPLWLLLASVAQAQSSLDGFDPGADRNVKALAVQPDGKIIVGGTFSNLGGGGIGTTTRKHIGRLSPDGSLDVNFNPGANDIIDALAVQVDGKIVLGGFFTTLGGGGSGTTVRNRIGRVNADGSLDASFDPGANAEIYCLALQANGKILVGGSFTTLGGGGAGTVARNRIARLNADGTLDTTFNPGANDRICTIALQADGKILVGGNFTTLGGGGTGTVARSCIGRLNPDGTIDNTFNPGATGRGTVAEDSTVFAIVVQADGKVVFGGELTAAGGGTGTAFSRSQIARANADGTLDTSFDPGANNDVKGLALQADGKILVVGDFLKLGGGGTGLTTRNLIGRLNSDGTLDMSFDPGANNPAMICVTVQPDGKILVGGTCTTLGGGGSGIYPRNFFGRLYADGTLDNDFEPGANSSVRALAVQPDGKILAGGDFTTLGGGGGGVTARSRIGRLNSEGTLEAGFDPGANGTVQSLAVQADGKIVAGGSFTTLGNGAITVRNRLGRLNGDGTLDTAFTPAANRPVLALELQGDGKILVGGSFTALTGTGSSSTPRNRIGRLNPDGTLDLDFDPGANKPVRDLAVQPDGKIVVAGDFTTLGGGGTGTIAHKRLGRLNADGTLDASFNPIANLPVRAVAAQADGKILVAGDFTTLRSGGGTTVRNHLGRLNPDGTLDTSFNPGANGLVEELALQANGRILVAGDFTTLGGGGTGTTVRNKLGRLNADGTLDTSFDPGANLAVLALAIEADGKIFAGGNFTTLGGGGTGLTTRNSIGRLTNTDAALQTLAVATDGTTITWSRGGASPEIDRATFQLSTDGTTYTELATPTRIPGGWQLTGQALPTQQNLFLRARGFYSTGESDGSGSVVQSVRNAFISSSPSF